MSERIICNDNGGELRDEIVRCRDCRKCLPDIPHDKDVEPSIWYCKMLCVSVEPWRFCAWGERRSDG